MSVSDSYPWKIDQNSANSFEREEKEGKVIIYDHTQFPMFHRFEEKGYLRLYGYFDSRKWYKVQYKEFKEVKEDDKISISGVRGKCFVYEKV